MKHFPKSLAILAISVAFVGTCQRLQAQGGDLTISAGSNDFTDPIIIAPVPIIEFNPSYAGNATQTAADGTVKTGTFTVVVSTNGRLTGSIILGATATSYTGHLSRKATGDRGETGYGYLVAADASGNHIAGSPKVPLIVNASFAYGGTLDDTGTTLVFRAVRSTTDGTVLGITGNLPTGTVLVNNGGTISTGTTVPTTTTGIPGLTLGTGSLTVNGTNVSGILSSTGLTFGGGAFTLTGTITINTPAGAISITPSTGIITIPTATGTLTFPTSTGTITIEGSGS